LSETTKGYSLQFWLLCLSSFFFFASFNMMIPELPAYLDKMGGGDYKGFLIALFTLTAGISRPFSGKLTDTVGRIPVMLYGSLVCVVCGFIYPFANVVWALLAIRVIHGFSTGFKPTGTSAYVADIVDPTKRGEAMGLNGIFGNIGMAAGPLLGSLLVQYFSFNTMFIASSGLAALSVFVLLGMKETVMKKQKFQLSLLRISWKDIFEPKVLMPFIVIILCDFSYGVVLTVMPDFSSHLGIQNKALYLATFTIASLSVRFFAGRISDIYGRTIVLKVATLILAGALFYMGLATKPFEMIIATAMFGLSLGIISPALFAWAIDLSHIEYRGKAMATVYIGLEIGIGTGALISGWIWGNKAENFTTTFWSASFLGFVAFIVLMFGGAFKTLPSKNSI
jgi:MFS family permease